MSNRQIRSKASINPQCAFRSPFLYVLSHLQDVAVISSTTTIKIQNSQAEARSNVKDDYVHVGLSVGDAGRGGGGGGGGGGAGGGSITFLWAAKWLIQHVIYMGVTKQCTSSFKCTFTCTVNAQLNVRLKHETSITCTLSHCVNKCIYAYGKHDLNMM